MYNKNKNKIPKREREGAIDLENRIVAQTTIVLNKKIKRVVDYAHRRCHFPESLFPLLYAGFYLGLGLLVLLPLFDYMEHILGMRRFPRLLSMTGIGLGTSFTRRRQRGRSWEHQDYIDVNRPERGGFLILLGIGLLSLFSLSSRQWTLAAYINLSIGFVLLAVYTWKSWKSPFQRGCSIINADERTTYVFTEEKIVFGSDGRRRLSYDLIRYMVETEEHFILFENENRAHVIPKSQIVEGDVKQLRWMLQAQAESMVHRCDTDRDFTKCKRLFYITMALVFVLAVVFTTWL